MKKIKIILENIMINIGDLFSCLKRAIKFFKIGWKDRDWDYGYLLDIEGYKFKKMYEYYSTSEITPKDDTVARDMKIMISLYNIIKGDDSVCLFEDFTREFSVNPKAYVNTRNARRFISEQQIRQIQSPTIFRNSYKSLIVDNLRIEKAWHLYNLMREYNMRDWWD